MTLTAMPRRTVRRSSPVPGSHLPTPPSDDDKYSYLGVQRRWPFVWIFVAQATLVYAFVSVMVHSVASSLGLILLTFTVPPLLVNLWLRIRRRRITLEDHVTHIEAWRRRRTDWPSVDVLVPCCGEDPAVLDNTFRHIAMLDWPGRLEVHVLDDADDAATRDLARAWGLGYVVRPNRGEWKKAGNLIHAFESTSAELVAVFDADFAPRPDFLYETVPYMDDPRTGVVQTAQYFDVDSRVNDFARYAGTLQELFFRWIQPARDTYEAAICAGTNVLYRRAAVEAAGGFAKVPLGEDVHSGVKIWVADFRTRYLPLVLAKGLAPSTWSALTNQQYRWCRSSMLLMVSSFFRDAPFGWRQRVCFWAAFLYYMSSAAMMLTAVLPTAIMLWFHPSELSAWHYLAVVPALVSTWAVFPLLARGWSPMIFRVCMINTFCHALAVLDALRNQVQAWVPTGASASAPRKRVGVPRRVALIGRTWFVLTQLVIWGGVVRYALAGQDVLDIWPLLALWGLQVYLLLPLVLRLQPSRRSHTRSLEGRRTHPDPVPVTPLPAHRLGA
ncbi:glycosyltransferase [Aeromicrobium wangtongii]|uniref:glycosyltransferase n=1 Tax=Aeromicrobium wangtongii TaxID=2969247 RepID=UPI002017E8FD|nr:glycosyltransferase [Aeromicrobium wangtongii]MCL3817437.1 glycosyltransferase [Aeromicrobium wangtongii]